jgi:hypothetical protein
MEHGSAMACVSVTLYWPDASVVVERSPPTQRADTVAPAIAVDVAAVPLTVVAAGGVTGGVSSPLPPQPDRPALPSNATAEAIAVIQGEGL